MLAVAIPMFVVAYLLFKGAKNPAILLLLVIVPFLGRSIFIDGQSWVVYSGAVEVGAREFVLTGLVALWAYLRRVRPRQAAGFPGIPAVAAGAMALVVVLQVVLAVMAGATAGAIAPVFVAWGYPVAGFFLCYGILRRVTDKEVLGMCEAATVVTVITFLPYIATAAGYPAYPFESLQTIQLADSVVVRDFLTLPPLCGLAFAYLVARPKATLGWFAMTGVVSIGLLSTFTRSIIIAAVVALAMAALLRLTEPGRARDRWGPTSAALAVAALAWAAWAATSATSGYLLERFGALMGMGLRDSNVASRLVTVEAALQSVRGGNALLGIGIHDAGGSAARALYAAYNFGDVMWAPALLTMGLAGVSALALTYAGGLWSGARAFFAEDGDRKTIALVAALTVVQLLLVSLAGGGILSMGAASGLFFGMAAVAGRMDWASEQDVSVSARSRQGARFISLSAREMKVVFVLVIFLDVCLGVLLGRR